MPKDQGSVRRDRLNRDRASKFRKALEAAYLLKDREPLWQDVRDGLGDMLVDALHYASFLKGSSEFRGSADDPAGLLGKDLASLAEGALRLYQDEATDA